MIMTSCVSAAPALMVQEIKATLVECKNKQLADWQRQQQDKQKELDSLKRELEQLKAQTEKRIEETKRKQWVGGRWGQLLFEWP